MESLVKPLKFNFKGFFVCLYFAFFKTFIVLLIKLCYNYNGDNMKRVFFGLLLFIYLFISVVVTVFLVNLDDNKVSVLDNKYFINVNQNVGSYDKGDLLVIPQKSKNNLMVNDEIIYFNSDNDLSTDKITEIKSLINKQNYIHLSSGDDVKSLNVVGKTSDVKKISVVGGILNVLESKWGYLCIIILPIFLVFAFEIYSISKEFKKKDK